jgi:Transcriptional regulator
MDIRTLEYFLVVAQDQNITKASQFLHVTQPTLSRQLASLEEELGVKLFDRTNHSTVLTEEGAIFRRRAQDIVSMARRAKEEVQQDEAELTGTIAVGSVELMSVRELGRLIAAFQEKNPAVKFELYSSDNEDIDNRLHQGTLDVGLCLEPFNTEGYEYIQMRTKEQWGVLIYDEHPLASQDDIKPGELVGTKVMTIHVGTPTHMQLVKWSGKYAKKMDFYANYNVLYNAVMVARERHDVVICLKQDTSYDHMKFLPLNPKLECGSVLIWRSGQNFSKATESFIQFVQDIYQ